MLTQKMKKNNVKRDPFIHLTRLPDPKARHYWFSKLISVVIALLICALITNAMAPNSFGSFFQYLGMGLVGNMNIIDNMMLRSFRKGHSIFLNRKKPKYLAEEIVDELEVVTPNLKTPVRNLSGGNIQKLLVGREISSSPKVLMVAYPVRGLDIKSSYTIYDLLNEQKERGTAVVFVGEDLDVLLALSDRILVLSGGKVAGIVDARTTTKEEIGLLMTKSIEKQEVSYNVSQEDEEE